MRQAFPLNLQARASFNSKRCDYESLSVSCSSIIFASFNSKRCDYEDKSIPSTNTRMPCFNSKRCDYECIRYLLNFSKNLFQFQKVRLWDCSLIAISSGLKCFNSKRCDYEPLLFAYVRLQRGFNSKRCDYESSADEKRTDGYLFQFQKVRLWVVRTEIWAVAVRRFNSKRCDYEF